MPAPIEEQLPATPIEANEIAANAITTGQLPPVEASDEVVTLQKDEMEARIQAAASARIEAEKEKARLAEAEAQGNYKQLYENEQAARKKAELASWRTKALTKYNLADEWFDSLAGDDEEAINKSAKAIKKRIDDAISAQQEQLLDSNIPSGPGNKRPPRDKKPDGKEITRRNMAAAFNIGNLPRIH